MKRKDFLKLLGLISTAVVATPLLASEFLKDKPEKIEIDADGFTITLPELQEGMEFKIVPTSNPIHEWVTLESDGTNWKIISE